MQMQGIQIKTWAETIKKSLIKISKVSNANFHNILQAFNLQKMQKYMILKREIANLSGINIKEQQVFQETKHLRWSKNKIKII